MHSRYPIVPLLIAHAFLLVASPVVAQRSGSWGRFSLFTYVSQRHEQDGFDSRFSQLVGVVTVRSPEDSDSRTEYSVDGRVTSYPSSDRAARASLYDAYVGVHTLGGKLGFRIGQMWLNDLGALGSVAGLHVGLRRKIASSGALLRLGAFAGLEPQNFETGYVKNVRKAGAYAVYEGHGARRHVLGFVTVRNGGLTERSVLTTTNFIPVSGRFFLYQIAEYDLQGPGGKGQGGLRYLFATTRIVPVSAIELELNYNHGRSIDARAITIDQLHGRPVDPRALEGFLFESAGMRVSVTAAKNLRFNVGYYRDKNNQDDRPHDRATAGLSVSNLFGSGVDVTAYDSRLDQGNGSYDSLYVSAGRSLGARLYLSVDYTSSLSVLRIARWDGVAIETRPRSQRFSLSSQLNLTRFISVYLTAERLTETTADETRLTSGVYLRF